MDDNGRPLRLLSLDGGGIRGLSSLYILKSIMTAARSKKAQTARDPLYPCEYFDLIAGASTGGLIAIMLGVLRMDVDSCINAYLDMAPKIFPVEGMASRSSLGKLIKVGWGKERFDPAPLEISIKNLVIDHLKTRSSDGEDTMLRFEASTMRQCKVFVCVTSEKLRKHFRFRSYESSWEVNDDCFIWQACRATSAAPTFFPPIMIGNPPTAYVDGGLGYNNPIRPLMEEASRIWPQRDIGCIVSIGTGVRDSRDVGRTIQSLFETLRDMSVDTENVAREFKEEIGSRYAKQNIYYRFNVQHGLEQVGLEEWKELDRTKLATQAYLNDHRAEVELCASQIHNSVDHISWAVTSTRTIASSTVPFSRDPKFVARNSIITKLDSILKTPGSHNRAALFGLGGIGKSQIAIEYSYIIRAQSPRTWVFWVHASSATRVEESFRNFASRINLPGRNDPKADILFLLSGWLEDEQNGSWLMILDNADVSNILLQSRPSTSHSAGNTSGLKRSLSGFIPQKPHGQVLITSRDRLAAYNLVGNYDNLVKVNPMNVSESLSLLKNNLSINKATEDDAIELLGALEHIPLAISQAGAYIRQQEPMMTIAIYLIEFRKSESNQATLLKKDTKDSRRDETMPNSVVVTWEISFNQIRQQHHSAADLLSLMSMFQQQRIPDFLIRENDDNLAFLDSINPLMNFSLIGVESEGNIFNMHRLVKLATRKWLVAHQSLQEWTTKAITRMTETFPNGEYENWGRCELLLPHAEQVLKYEAIEDESKLKHASLLENTAWYISRRGNYDAAVQKLEQSLKIRSQLLGKEDDLVLSSRAKLASTFWNQGRWKEAEELELQVMEMRKRVLGMEHSATLTSMANLASTFWNQGRWKEAEELNLQVIEMSKRVLGMEHPDTLISMNNLASMYSNQGRWKEAEELQLQVMKMSKRVLGMEHPDTLTSMANLASMFWGQGRWKEAEELQLQVMEMSKRVLGMEHPDTLTSMNNLAHTYKFEDRHDEAIELIKSVVQLRTKIIGAHHPDTLYSIRYLKNWSRI